MTVGIDLERNDAERLARYARNDTQMLQAITSRSPERQADLAHIRVRDALLRIHTLLVNLTRGLATEARHRLTKNRRREGNKIE